MNLLKLVESGDLGEPAAVLYRVLYTFYTMQQAQQTPQEKEIEKSVTETKMAPAKEL